MKKIIAFALLVAAVGATAGVRYIGNDEPEYIQSAETRVGSYLTSDYGRVACNSKQVDDQRWELDCLHQARGKVFQFAVYPSEKAPMVFRVRFISKRLMMKQNRAPNRV